MSSFINATVNNTASGNASKPASGSENRKPATAQQLVRENVQHLIERLESGHSEALTAFLDAMAHFRTYSFGNILLIARQKPEATNVAGMWAWNQLGRRVKRGEKGIAILAPMIAKVRKEDRNNDNQADNGQRFSSTNGDRIIAARKTTNTAATQFGLTVISRCLSCS